MALLVNLTRLVSLLTTINSLHGLSHLWRLSQMFIIQLRWLDLLVLVLLNLLILPHLLGHGCRALEVTFTQAKRRRINRAIYHRLATYWMIQGHLLGDVQLVVCIVHFLLLCQKCLLLVIVLLHCRVVGCWDSWLSFKMFFTLLSLEMFPTVCFTLRMWHMVLIVLISSLDWKVFAFFFDWTVGGIDGGSNRVSNPHVWDLCNGHLIMVISIYWWLVTYPT